MTTTYSKDLSEIVLGFVTLAIQMSISNSDAIDSTSITYFGAINIVVIVLLLLILPIWGGIYLIGWILSTLLFYSNGMIGFIELGFYIAVPGLMLLFRALRSATKSVY